MSKLLLIVCLLLNACVQEAPTLGELRVGVAELPMTLDPRFATDAASQKVQSFIHRGLVRQDDHFVPQADLALRWTHDDESLVWDFFLRKDLYFHDGAAVEAEDVAATLRSVMDASMASPLRAGFANIANIEVMGAKHVRLHLSKPDSSLLTRLSLGVLPRAVAMLPQQQRGVVGSGPFSFESWQGNRLSLLRVPTGEDWADSTVRVLQFIRVKDAVTRCLKLVRGEIDFMQNDLPLHMLAYLRKQQGVKIATTPSTTFSYVGINMQDEFLSDVRVRRALALAVNRSKLKQALLLDAPVLAETVLTPSHWAAATLDQTAYDVVEAARLLDAAGYPKQDDGWRFHLTYRTSTNPTRLNLATAIAAQWRELGVDVSIESLEWGAFYARIKRGDFQLFSLSWVGISDPDIYRWILHTTMWPPKGANRGRYSDSQMDQWLEEAMAAESMRERSLLYHKVQKKMQLDQVYIPLWYEPVVAVSGPRVSGFVPQVDGGLSQLSFVKLGE